MCIKTLIKVLGFMNEKHQIITQRLLLCCLLNCVLNYQPETSKIRPVHRCMNIKVSFIYTWTIFNVTWLRLKWMQKFPEYIVKKFKEINVILFALLQIIPKESKNKGASSRLPYFKYSYATKVTPNPLLSKAFTNK